MTMNFPGPYVVEIFYTIDGLTHKQALNVDVTNAPDPGDTFADCDVLMKGGGSYFLSFCVDAWVQVLIPLLPVAMTIDMATLWEYTPLSFERRWIADYSIGEVGTNVATYTPAGEWIVTFRTTEGGIMQIRLEEIGVATFGKWPVGLMTPGQPDANLVAYVLSDLNWIKARDTSYPVVGMYSLRGQNEAVFKQRYR